GSAVYWTLPYGGRREEGLAAIEEAVTIRRRLAAANPAAHEPDLATSLWVSANLRAGEDSELLRALRDVREAVVLFRTRAEQTPAVFLARLHTALGVQADVLDDLGRTAEAQEIRRQIPDSHDQG
ncbi:hypothetical protein RKE29_27425, partial [Streptomyces sp. B1866]|nr:hypothetical protein [Streptomyces sp. B1866]